MTSHGQQPRLEVCKKAVVPRVAVLLPTYNGERYLTELLDSVAQQREVKPMLVIRDDGSTDGTHQILARHTQCQAPAAVHYGSNCGTIASFFALMKLVPPECEYVAFCDQDDVWRADKLSRAVNYLRATRGPARMYCSRYVVTDEDLVRRRISPRLRRPPSFGNALLENIAIGCSIMIDRATLDLAVSRPPAIDQIVMHDWWLYLLASGMGTVVFDDEAPLWYRQHDSNVMGLQRGFATWIARSKRHSASGGRHPLVSQALEFSRCFSDKLASDNRELLQTFSKCIRATHLHDRLHLAREPRLLRQRRIDDFVMRAMIVTGRL